MFTPAANLVMDDFSCQSDEFQSQSNKFSSHWDELICQKGEFICQWDSQLPNNEFTSAYSDAALAQRPCVKKK